LNPQGGLTYYPGSPKLARLLFRPQDRLSAMELHPDDYETLHRLFDGDFQSRITRLDGWLSLGAHLPPKEKRGIVLVDPPFEIEGEYERLVDGLQKAVRRFPGGVYCLWYPLKKNAPIAAFHKALKETGIPKMLCAELTVKQRPRDDGTDGLRPHRRQSTLYAEAGARRAAALPQGTAGAGPLRLGPRLLDRRARRRPLDLCRPAATIARRTGRPQ
jgi:23S rRNA A2030 N6-methylase RlmJ